MPGAGRSYSPPGSPIALPQATTHPPLGRRPRSATSIRPPGSGRRPTLRHVPGRLTRPRRTHTGARRHQRRTGRGRRPKGHRRRRRTARRAASRTCTRCGRRRVRPTSGPGVPRRSTGGHPTGFPQAPPQPARLPRHATASSGPAAVCSPPMAVHRTQDPLSGRTGTQSGVETREGVPGLREGSCLFRPRLPKVGITHDWTAVYRNAAVPTLSASICPYGRRSDGGPRTSVQRTPRSPAHAANRRCASRSSRDSFADATSSLRPSLVHGRRGGPPGLPPCTSSHGRQSAARPSGFPYRPWSAH
jgi:hypothetical protein